MEPKEASHNVMDRDLIHHHESRPDKLSLWDGQRLRWESYSGEQTEASYTVKYRGSTQSRCDGQRLCWG
eukprot:827013-Pelagomonas_calceolata.AAC.3